MLQTKEKTMKKEKQKIKIAEACGWIDVTKRWRFESDDSNDGYNVLAGVLPNGRQVDVPDYLNDLNAMHKAEKILTLSQRREYTQKWLVMAAGSPNMPMATAEQRAEAFLRTLGLWDGGND